MLERSAQREHENPRSRAPADFQEHLANLEAAGLLLRIDREVNKDTELHPLVRWQFLGGLDEDRRRAFLFTNVVGADGRRFDMPVVVGALSASARIYALGMGCAVDDIGKAWTAAIGHPIPPVTVASPRCQEVVIVGDDLHRPGGGLARLP
ncbi:MAG: UbiD family decarboxylase, partial [Alphaproteobacteria bacterium]|nr:UbiD family decarboxylase [Alphaproteobacteria bacterium]